jgi:hypothetical protein
MNEDAASRAGRRATDPLLAENAATATFTTNLPVVTAAPEPKAAAFDAQLYGQGGQKRGLRGGKPVLDHARAAYLETEWSGATDRRPPKGMLTKTKV